MSDKPKFEEWSAGLVFAICGASMLAALIVGLLLVACVRIKSSLQLNELKKSFDGVKPEKVKILGFFHPNCDAGAGGEKVLWSAVQSIQTSMSKKGEKYTIQILMYSGSKMQPQDILKQKVSDRFGIKASLDNLHFVSMNEQKYKALDPKNYPTFTLFWQCLAFIDACVHCMHIQPCDIFIDTMGVGFGYPFIKVLFGVKLYSYTHYPIVSTDMVKTVEDNDTQFNNRADIASSPTKQKIKIAYYHLLIKFYKLCGWFADQVAANSSWTRGHMDELWSKGDSIKTIYPPCDTTEFQQNCSLEGKRDNLMISFAQFRPEKQHDLQLRVWKDCISKPDFPKDAHFKMIGSVRGPEDQAIVDNLKKLAVELGINDRVSFQIGASRNQLFEIFSKAKVAVHCMKKEHFGIAVVELMSSGIITIAHNSAGPKEDIIGGAPYPVGYLADSQEDYAFFVRKAMMEYDTKDHQDMRVNSRKWVVEQFGMAAFNKQFIDQIEQLL